MREGGMLLAREEVVRSWTGLQRQAPNERLQADPSSRDVTRVPRPTWEEASNRPREFPIKYPSGMARCSMTSSNGWARAAAASLNLTLTAGRGNELPATSRR